MGVGGTNEKKGAQNDQCTVYVCMEKLQWSHYFIQQIGVNKHELYNEDLIQEVQLANI
jgi:hypothetical protein